MTTLKTTKTLLLPDKSIISFQMQGGRSARRDETASAPGTQEFERKKRIDPDGDLRA